MATAACPSCGRDLPDDATHCPSCHRPVDAVDAVDPVDDQPPGGPQAPPEPGAESPGRAWDAAIVTSGMLLVLIVIVAWLL